MPPSAKTGHAKYGAQRKLYEKNRLKILKTQTVCGICGREVDMSLRFPHPLSPCVDHIIPVDKGGESNIENLQLAHLSCNRAKSDKLFLNERKKKYSDSDVLISNRNLPHTFDWLHFSGS